MSESSARKLQFIPNWRASVLAVVLLPLLLTLGNWQLERAEEKRQLQQLFDERQAREPAAIEGLSPTADLRYQPVKLRGRFVNEKNLLLDNRIYQRRFGYEIITPFQLSSNGLWVLVNRGFLAGDISRRNLPSIDAITEELELIGEVHVPHGDMMTLAEDTASGWPRVIQVLAIEKIAKELGKELFPYTVRIKSPTQGSFEANWMVVNLQPEKHTGYAVQWFAMSAALVMIILLANTNIWQLLLKTDKKQTEKKTTDHSNEI